MTAILPYPQYVNKPDVAHNGNILCPVAMIWARPNALNVENAVDQRQC